VIAWASFLRSCVALGTLRGGVVPMASELRFSRCDSLTIANATRLNRTTYPKRVKKGDKQVRR